MRPEQLRVRRRDDESAATAGAGLPGTVEQCRYYGHDALLHIHPDSRRDDATTEAGAMLIARVRGEQALAPGTAVLLSARGRVSAVR